MKPKKESFFKILFPRTIPVTFFFVAVSFLLSFKKVISASLPDNTGLQPVVVITQKAPDTFSIIRISTPYRHNTSFLSLCAIVIFYHTKKIQKKGLKKDLFLFVSWRKKNGNDL